MYNTFIHIYIHMCVYIYIYICMYVYIYIYIHPKRELEYRIPRLHSPENSQRFPEISGDVRKNSTSFL